MTRALRQAFEARLLAARLWVVLLLAALPALLVRGRVLRPEEEPRLPSVPTDPQPLPIS
ncbi:hypothetical protein WKI71_00130 [Streptomyces sp. MS1.AVA.1]|uniref:Uncharacterized protein n=1 Tax=Streptomyces machairae TaxID=3134109 RepID=A0ABU8UF42_9ACTN